MTKFKFLYLIVLCLLFRGGYAAEVTADFGKTVGEVNPKLHSAGWGPRIYPRAIKLDDPDIKPLGLYAARTHDWALINHGQRIFDTHFVFPLMHLDPKDPKNYFFDATDEALKLSRSIGLKILYRLGSSIEHTVDKHFNVFEPEDDEKYAEVLAGIMRHYLKGWANGYEWDFDGWEIWNEPDGIDNCFVMRDCQEKDPDKRWVMHRDRFIKLFVTCLKRLKKEFPDQQIGGPALISANEGYFRALLKACKEADVAPDFVSWHGYTDEPKYYIDSTYKMRALLDEMGFKKTRMIIDEWHYIRTWQGIHGYNSTPEDTKKAMEGPTGHLNIDSAAMNLYTLCELQKTPLDEAFYYGCGMKGNWGYLDEYGDHNKCWYSMKMFGDFIRQTKFRVECLPSVVGKEAKNGAVTSIAGLSADRRTAMVLVVGYRDRNQELTLKVRGLGTPKRISAVVLDHTRDFAAVDVGWNDGNIVLPRQDAESAAFLVTMEL